MRRSLIPILAAVLAVACADAPTTPLQMPTGVSFERTQAPDYPPPPFAIISGDGATAENVAFTYTANFFVNKPGNVAWLMFTGGTNVSFSQGARLMSVNGDVSGFGTLTVGGTTYKLNTVNEFSFDGNCTSTIRSSCAGFSGDGFTSSSSVWTGQLAGGGRGRDGGKPGGGNDPPEACIPDETGDCGFIFNP